MTPIPIGVHLSRESHDLPIALAVAQLLEPAVHLTEVIGLRCDTGGFHPAFCTLLFYSLIISFRTITRSST